MTQLFFLVKRITAPGEGVTLPSDLRQVAGGAGSSSMMGTGKGGRPARDGVRIATALAGLAMTSEWGMRCGYPTTTVIARPAWGWSWQSVPSSYKKTVLPMRS